MTLLQRYEDKITSLEMLNKQAVKQRDQKVGSASAQPARQVNISLPPFSSPSNEPYGDNQILKFGSQF
jgi:hypothetical protein